MIRLTLQAVHRDFDKLSRKVWENCIVFQGIRSEEVYCFPGCFKKWFPGSYVITYQPRLTNFTILIITLPIKWHLTTKCMPWQKKIIIRFVTLLPLLLQVYSGSGGQKSILFSRFSREFSEQALFQIPWTPCFTHIFIHTFHYKAHIWRE